MDFNILRTDDSVALLTTQNVQMQNSTSLPSDVQDFDPSDFTEEYLSDDVVMADERENADKFDIANNIPSSVDTDDILRNGILVETNKGVVCMSLKDVLSSNLNLSVDDIKQVAAQLLSQEDGPSAFSENTEIQYDLVTNPDNNGTSIEVVPSQTGAIQPVTSDIEVKLDLAAPSPLTKLLIIPRIPDSIKEPIIQSSVLINNLENNEVLLNSHYGSVTHISDQFQSNSSVLSEAVDTSEENEKDKISAVVNVTVKRRGGWPKGRKRKPELLNLPPKAPKTSYNIFLNERRKLYKDKLAFHEITRVVGNQWSSLTSEEKRPYVERAEEDKKRYREELRIYRQSDAYKLYLARKRKKRALDNLMSESDMDGTDDIDDEDNDMLYCDTCDQWFYNLHNKREHLLSRQHKMMVAGDMTKNLASSDSENKGHTSSVSFSTSLDESSMDGTPIETDSSVYSKPKMKETENVYDHMVRLIDSVAKREKEIKVLDSRLNESISLQNSYLSELNSLKERSNMLKGELSQLKQEEISLEQQICRLWNVPSLFVMNTVEFVNIV